MARTTTKRKTTRKKPVAKKATAQKTQVNTITITTQPTDDDLILGAKPETKTVELYDVFNRKCMFEVENANGDKTITNGKVVETLFHKYATEEKLQLQKGAKEVVIKDKYKRELMYIIRTIQ